MNKRDKLALAGLCIGYGMLEVAGLLGDIVLGACAWAFTTIIVIAMWVKIK